MPKANSLKYVCSTLNDFVQKQQGESRARPPSKKTAASKNHFIFLLGTDTAFTEEPTHGTRSYQRGETLSYTAQAITSMLGETAEKNPNEALSYSSPSVDVLNGPSTLGTEVSARIAQAVLLALRAAADGTETLQIAAHSRGAVEAVLVMHELARIKKELLDKPEKSLYEILTTSPSKPTSINDAMKALCETKPAPGDDNPQSRTELLKRLENLKINSFLIDPVPGDTVFGFPKLAWHDDRFYEKLPEGNHELLLCRDERSACFYPIVPEGITPVIIPGQHGTPSGNLYDQQYKSGDPNSTYTVQDLVLTKLFNFIDNTTDVLHNRDQKLNLKHRELDALVNKYLAADEEGREQLLLDCYEKVAEKDDEFLAFRNTNYLLLSPSDRTHRYVHYGKQAYTTMTNPSQNNVFNEDYAGRLLKKFVRPERVASSLSDSVRDLTLAFRIIIADMRKDKQAGAKKLTLLDLIEDEKTQDRFFNALSAKASRISEQYLSSNLSESDQDAFIAAIAETFTLLKSVGTEQPALTAVHQKIIENCEAFFKNSIKKTAEVHFQVICEQSTQLYKQIHLFLTPLTDFSTTFQTYIDKLEAQNKTDDSKTPSNEKEFLTLAIKQLHSMTPLTIQQMKTTVAQIISEIGKFPPERQETLRNNLFGGKEFSTLNDHVEAHEYTIDDYLKQIEQQYHALNQIMDMHKKLHPYVEPINDKFEQQLNLQKEGLVTLGGQLLRHTNANLKVKPEAIFDDNFFALISSKAIMLGSTSPEITDLQQEVLSLKQQSFSLTQAIDTLKNSIQTKDSILRSVTNGHRSHNAEMDKKNKEMENLLREEKARAEQLQSKYQDELEKNQHQVVGLEGKIADLTSKLARIEKEAASAKELNTEQAGEINTLKTEIVRLSDAHTAETVIQSENLALKTETESLREKNSGLLSKIENMIREQKERLEINSRALRTQEDKYQPQIAKLTVTLEQQVHELEALREENLALKETHESDLLSQTEKGVLASRNEVLLSQVEQLTLENKRVQERLDTMTSLMATQQAALDSLELAHEVLLAQKEELASSNSALLSENNLLRANLAAESEQMTAKITELQEKNQSEGQQNQETIEQLRQKNLELEAKIAAQVTEPSVPEVVVGDANTDRTMEELNALREQNIRYKNELQASVAAIRAQEELNHQVLSEEESNCATVVYKKLIPLTKNYREHLLKAAKHYYSGEINATNLPSASSLTLKEPEKQAYEDIRIKLEKVFELYRCLDPIQKPGIEQKHSDRIINFTKILNGCERDLGKSRGETWKTYAKNCLAALAILATGIIPGLVGLLAYSKTTGRSPMFFSQSKGQEFVKETNASTPKPKRTP